MSEFGILLINKPAGITSFDVIRKLRKITKMKKIGHTGTLDPFAEGLLPICVGKATRIAELFSSKKKQYLVEMKFGEKTDSGDITGKIVDSTKINRINLTNIEKIIPKILKMKEQIPPIYSAIKINGKRAYKYARENEKIEIPPRQIEIFDFEIVDFNFPFFTYKTTVSKGTYIRVLSEDIANMLGTIGMTTKLKRVQVGDFDISQTVNLDKLNFQNWKDYLHEISKLMKDFPKIEIEEIDTFANGNRISVVHSDVAEIMILNENRCIGFGKIESGKLYPKKVMI